MLSPLDSGAAGTIANDGTGDGALLAPVEFLEAVNTGALDLHIDGDHARVAGGRGDDRLDVNGTGNTIAGGKGDDLIVVGGADNVVEYRPGDGEDTVRSLAATGTVIRFGAGIVVFEELKSQSLQDGESGRWADAVHIATNNDNWRYVA